MNYSYASVGLTVNADDDHVKNLLRYYIAPYACHFGVEMCLKDAESNVAKYKVNQSR